MLVQITDTAGTSGSVITDTNDLATTITPWYPDAPAEVTNAITELQATINRGEDYAELAAYLAVDITVVR